PIRAFSQTGRRLLRQCFDSASGAPRVIPEGQSKHCRIRAERASKQSRIDEQQCSKNCRKASGIANSKVFLSLVVPLWYLFFHKLLSLFISFSIPNCPELSLCFKSHRIQPSLAADISERSCMRTY